MAGRNRDRFLASCLVVSTIAITACGSGPVDPVVYADEIELLPAVSAPIRFEVPDGTVAVSILARSTDPTALLRIGRMTFDDVTVLDGRVSDPDEMRRMHAEFEVVDDGGFVQEIQLGTLAFTYPFAPGWPVPAGHARLEFWTDRPTALAVEVLAVQPGERSAVPVVVHTAAGRALHPDARAEVERIFGQAELTVHWSDGSLPGAVPATIDDVERRDPDSQLGRLFAAIESSGVPGLHLVLVESLPGGLSGLASSIPGPHDGTGTAVTVSFRSPQETGRLIAHELMHLLGLRHLEDRSTRGVVVQNPIPDTRAEAFNLMQFGSELTPGQIEVLRLSPLLRSR